MLIKTIGRDGIIGTQVLSFKRLAYKIFNEENFEGEYIKDSGKQMLIYSIMIKHEKDLQILKHVSKNVGLVDTVVNMIEEFKRYNVLPEMLKNINIKNEYLKMKLNDLYIIYNDFENRIKGKYVDISDELTILANIIPNTKILDGAKIWIDEFDGFTPQEMKVITELDKKADITIAITTDNNENELFKLNNKNIKRVIENCKSYNSGENVQLNEQHRLISNELKHLEKNIYKYPYEKYDKKVDDIKIVLSANPYAEIEDVASEISKLVRNGMRYENIAILTNDIDKYKNLINKIFKLYNVPYFLDNTKELTSQPLISLVMSLLDICANNYKYENMFTYLKSGLTNIKDVNDIDMIENCVLAYGIKGNSWLKEWDFDKTYDKEKINMLRSQVIEPIIAFKKTLLSRKTVKEIIESLYAFLIDIGAYKNIEEKIDILKNKNTISAIETANEYVQVWNALISILDEMAEALGEEQVSFETFRNILNIGISSHKIGIIPTTKDQVVVGDSGRTRNNNIKVLFIIGVVDGAFPKTFQSEGFINDNERNLLLENGMEIAKDTKMLLLEENFNIYKALTTASEKLYISYPVANIEGESSRPSSIIGQIKRIFSEIEEDSKVIRDGDTADFICTKDSTMPYLLTQIRNKMDGETINSIWEDTYHWYNENMSDFKKIKTGLDYKNTIEYMDKTITRKLYGDNINASVSKLEKFEMCPFSFYLKYGLNAKERKVYKLENPDIGSFLHAVIDEFSRYILEQNVSWRDLEKEKCDSIVETIVNEELEGFKNNLLNSSSRLKSLASKLKRLVKRVIWLIATQLKDGEFDVSGSEVEFGSGKEYKAIEIDIDNKTKISLSGKVDRIDVAKTEDGNYIRIIDYKSSDKEIKLSDVYYGVQLQLLTYLDAVAKDYLPGGVLYLKLDDPIIKSNPNVSPEEIEDKINAKLRMKGLVLANARLVRAMDKNMDKKSNIIKLALKADGTYTGMPVATEEQFENLRDHIRSTLKEIGNEIMSGNVKNEPIKRENRSVCEFCEYFSICQFNRNLGNKYKVLDKLKDEEVYKRIKKDMKTKE